MNIILYSILEDEAGKKLQRSIEMLVRGENFEVFSTFNSLSLRLHQPLDDIRLVVLNASSKQDLIDIISLRDILWNVRVILVLPDRDAATTSMGHILRPRLISYADSDSLEVFAVLSRMIVANDKVKDASWKHDQTHSGGH
jgi:hypothetical protein